MSALSLSLECLSRARATERGVMISCRRLMAIRSRQMLTKPAVGCSTALMWAATCPSTVFSILAFTIRAAVSLLLTASSTCMTTHTFCEQGRVGLGEQLRQDV